MGQGSPRAGVAYLLKQAGLMPDVGQGMPQRTPSDTGTRPYVGPNLSDYQKLLALAGPPAPVIQLTAFQRLNTQPVVLTVANTDVLAVTSPPQIRSFVMVVNASTSAGTMWIAWDLVANATTGVPLPPGGIVFFDTFVPQNDLHLACSLAPTTGIIFYANASFNPSQT